MDKYKNDVKTLFFVCNSINGVGLGLLFFSSGVRSGVLKNVESDEIVDFVLGLGYISILGLHWCFGTVAEPNVKMLEFYIFTMCVRSVIYVVTLVEWIGVEAIPKDTDLHDSFALEALYAATVFITVITRVCAILSLTLATTADTNVGGGDSLTKAT